jgi:hypothetical protein
MSIVGRLVEHSLEEYGARRTILKRASKVDLLEWVRDIFGHCYMFCTMLSLRSE